MHDLSKEFVRTKEPTGRFSTIRRLFTRERVIKKAVQGVSFDIEAGELIGYLGANGAGKSTTIKMLTGILVPTSGTVEVAGVVPWQDRKANALRIGAVFGQRTQLWTDLPLRDSLELVRDLYGVPQDVYGQRLAQLTELLGLAEFLDTPVRFLSLGQRMRGDLVAALLYEPEILYLDEPTVGLDVVAKRTIREFIAAINDQLATTIMLTTHDMEDIEALCKRIIIIDDGQVLFDGALTELKRRYVTERVLQLTPADGINPTSITVDGTTAEVSDDGLVALRFDPRTLSAPTLMRAVTERFEVTDLSLADTPLSDVISQIYAESAVRSRKTA
ncbi:ABC transporter ATP-binding protein [Aestuariimicrobium sp. T2.26MG-19.2B]|uniref:ABC transporter ATP-binding protein n=1 Tax=Aestuariimicrobium sp. T2.26MG-19.2B TaxID=3040679 RepID=UPI0025422890|nr:ATP-binding cassette domain-containing protein [Aestuariimicrobium sp. T2.26MG-19.2B]